MLNHTFFNSADTHEQLTLVRCQGSLQADCLLFLGQRTQGNGIGISERFELLIRVQLQEVPRIYGLQADSFTRMEEGKNKKLVLAVGMSCSAHSKPVRL